MSDENEKPKRTQKEKAVDDVKACTAEGKDLDRCVNDAKKTHGLTDEEADLVKWDAGRKKK